HSSQRLAIALHSSSGKGVSHLRYSIIGAVAPKQRIASCPDANAYAGYRWWFEFAQNNLDLI
ncbi:MAG: hypothetical protein RLP02_10980, partial [Coleofasciculus sp. C2-GNP5-27]